MKKLLIALMLIILNTISLNAKELTIEDAINLALTQSDDIKIIETNLLQVEEILKEARSAMVFTIDANADYSRGFIKGEVAGPPISAIDADSYTSNLGISVNQPLFTFGRLLSAVRAAKENIKSANYEAENAKRQLKYNMQSLYYSALYYSKLLEIAQSSYNNALNSKKLISNNISRAGKSDLIKVDSDIATRKPEIAKYEYIEKETKRAIKLLANIPENEEIELVSSFDASTNNPYDKEEQLKELENHPELNALQSKISYYENSAKAKRSSYKPQINAVAGFNRSYESQEANLNDAVIQNNSYIGLNLNVSLWDGGSSKAASSQDKLSAKSTQIELENTKKSLKQELDNAFEKYDYYVGIYQNQQDAVKLAQKSYNNSLQRFKAGQTSATELNDVEIALTQNAQALQGTILELHNIIATIEKLTQNIKTYEY